MTEDEFDADAYDEEIHSDAFNHGMSVGESIGAYEAAREAQRAYDLGEIELWLDYNRPKSLEEWALWKETHGSHEEFQKRWK